MTSSDAQLRDAERRLAADPHDEAAIEAATRASERVGCPLPYHALAGQPRWRWLRNLAETFYAEPLHEAGGLSVADLDRWEAKNRARLPGVLREWHRLVGRRLQQVDDVPYQLETWNLSSREHVGVWLEGSDALWVAYSPLTGGEDDPLLLVQGSRPGTPRLSAFLRGLTLRETLRGAYAATLRGPLGALAPTILGGSHLNQGLDDELAMRLEVSFPQLEPLTLESRPPHGTPPLGTPDPITRESPNAETVPLWGNSATLVLDSGHLWATSRAEDYALLRRLLNLERGSAANLHVFLEDLSPAELKAHGAGNRFGLAPRLRRRLTEQDRVPLQQQHPDRATLELVICAVDAGLAFIALRELLEVDGLLERAAIARRAHWGGPLEVLWPPGREDFVLPWKPPEPVYI